MVLGYLEEIKDYKYINSLVEILKNINVSNTDLSLKSNLNHLPDSSYIKNSLKEITKYKFQNNSDWLIWWEENKNEYLNK